MSFYKTFLTAAAATLFLVVGAGSALAYSAIATGSVNVRTGPGVGYAKVGTLQRNEQVEVNQCQAGWCFVQRNGADGWVSANYLSRGGISSGSGSASGSGGGSNPNFNFSFGFGSNGGGFSFGNMPNRPNWPSQPVGACFFTGNNYTGQQFCVNSGRSMRAFGPAWNDKVSSVRVFGGASVMMCEHANYAGYCRTTNRNEPALGPWLNDKMSSIRVY